MDTILLYKKKLQHTTRVNKLTITTTTPGPKTKHKNKQQQHQQQQQQQQQNLKTKITDEKLIVHLQTPDSFFYASEACIFMSKMNITSVLYIKKSTHHFTAWTLYSLQLGWDRFIPRRSTGTVFAQRKRLLIDKVLFPAKHRSQMYGNNCNSGHSIGLSSIRKLLGNKCW